MKTLRDEMLEMQEHAKAIVSKALTEERDMTDEEQAQFKAATSELDRLEAKQAARTRAQGVLEDLSRRPLPALPQSNGHAAPAIVQPASGITYAKSYGAQFVESEGYLEFRASGGPRGGNWATSLIELKAPVGYPTIPAFAPGVLPGITGPLPLPRPPMMLSLLATGNVDGSVVAYLREKTWTNNAAIVAPGALKPESIKDFETIQQALAKIAHFVLVVDEMLMDVSGLRTFIDNQMEWGVLQKLEDQVLNGTGVAPNFMGLRVVPGHLTVAADADVPLASAILSAITQIQANGYQPNGIVMNPATFGLVVGQASPNAGYYLGPGTFQDTPALRFWGLPVVASSQMPAGEALVGAFSTAATLFRKDGVVTQASNSHADYFARNVTAIRAEIRAALAIYQPTAFALVTGLVAPAA